MNFHHKLYNPTMPLIACWSGPRSLSTALLRSWENRPDTTVIDEPFYACYLKQTGLPHPGAVEIMAQCETDWRKVIQQILTPPPPGHTIVYQKHMAHHMLPGIELDWLTQMRHCILIRDPADLLASLHRRMPNPTLQDTGLPQLERITETIRRVTGQHPPIFDCNDLLKNPQAMLKKLCAALDVPFSQNMLNWPPGPRKSDGIWAPFWYDIVIASTGFQPPRPVRQSPPEVSELLPPCREIYDRLAARRLTA